MSKSTFIKLLNSTRDCVEKLKDVLEDPEAFLEVTLPNENTVDDLCETAYEANDQLWRLHDRFIEMIDPEAELGWDLKMYYPKKG